MVRTFRWYLKEFSQNKGWEIVNEGGFTACTWREAKIRASKESGMRFGYWKDGRGACFKRENQRRVTLAPTLKLWVEKDEAKL